MSRSDRPDDVRPLLEDLQETLAALRTELDGETGERSDRSDRPPRPPSPRDLLRFTEEYTIPTLVSLLETTIRSLELLRGVLRLLDPERSPREPESSRLADSTGRRVAQGATTALSELRRALAEVDFPAEGEARDIVADARELSAELERRIEESETESRSVGAEEAIDIDVREPGTGAQSEGQESDSDERADVDVESELDSIRESVRGERADSGDETDDEEPEGGSTS